MPKLFSVSDDKLTSVEKALAAIVGDDAAKIAEITKALKPLAAEEIEVEKGTAEDPVADVLLGLHEAVAKIAKSTAANKDELLAETFEKAFGALADVYDETAELAYAAGSQAAATEIAKKGGKKDGKDGKDGGDGADGADCTDDGDGEDMEKILKGLSPRAGELFKGLSATNADLAKRLGVMEAAEEVRLLKAMAADAHEGDAFVEILKALPVDQRAKVVALAKSKNEQIRKGGLFTEIGGGAGADGADALTQLNAKASEISKASGGKISVAKAFGDACRDNPELYAEFKRSASK